MKKLFGMVVLLFFIYFLYQITFVYFQGGHNISYELKDGKTVFKINEILRSGRKSDADNYSLSIKVKDIEFNLQSFYNFGRSSSIIKEIKYYSDNENKCIFVKYRNNKVLNDITCMQNGIMIPYHNLTNISSDLQAFASSLKSDGYTSSNWEDSTKNTQTGLDSILLYKGNLISNHYIGVSNTKGFYRINTIDGVKNVEAYSNNLTLNDILLKGFVNDKFIILNYADDKLYRFYVENMTNNGSDLFSGITISNKAYTIGSHGTSLYIFDPESQKEYELDYKARNLLEVGNKDTGVTYYADGKWQRTAIENVGTIEFGNNYSNDYMNSTYDKIVKVGNKYGYYYMFKKIDSGYIVYRSDVTKKDALTYLFTTTNINNLVFSDDYIYYTNGNTLKYYSDETGNRTVLSNCDILNNPNVAIGVYIEKEN